MEQEVLQICKDEVIKLITRTKSKFSDTELKDAINDSFTYCIEHSKKGMEMNNVIIKYLVKKYLFATCQIHKFKNYDKTEIQNVYRRHHRHCGTVLFSTDKGYT